MKYQFVEGNQDDNGQGNFIGNKVVAERIRPENEGTFRPRYFIKKGTFKQALRHRPVISVTQDAKVKWL